MIVGRDVKNLDNMLLIPSGCKLTTRQIGILQAWGVTEIEIEAGGPGADTDLLAKLSPEALATLTDEIRATFWKADDQDPVFAELLKILLRRRASGPGVKVVL
jgi:hypothetical protein